MRSQPLLGLGLVLSLTGVSCTGVEHQPDQTIASTNTSRSTLAAFGELATLGRAQGLVARAGRLVPTSGLSSLDASLPLRAHEPVHLALRERAEISLDVADVDDAHVEGVVDAGSVAFAGIAPDVDAYAGLRGAAVETVRVLRSARASNSWRMRVAVGAGIATLRAREGRIEAVEPSGWVPLASAPLFAIDAAGTHRPLAVSVRPIDARTYDVEATLDARSLVYPIALDPLWSAAPSMAADHDQHTATLLSDGRVLVAGGDASFNPSAACEIFDPKTNTWSTVASMTTARSEHTATLLGDGRVFVAFGAGVGTGRPKLNTAEIYDPKTNKWTDVSTTGFTKPIARVAHTATLLPTGEVFLAGGVTGTSPESTTGRQVLYNPTTGSWNIPFDPGFASFMKEPRAYHAAVLVGSKVFALGGEKIDTAGTATPLASIESWSAATGWVLSPAKLGKARCEHAATVTGAGSIVLVGGGSKCRGIGSTPVAAGELYDPTTDKVAASAPALVTARSRHTLTTLASGQLLVTGGVGNTGAGGAFFSSAEVFDGTAWTAVASMASTRSRHTATLLGDGRVLVVGSGPDKSAEMFAPTTVGTSCTSGTTCASGFCADGVCCDTKCDGNCESCVVTGAIGTCKPIVGPPLGGRPKCDDGAGNACKAKRCDGKSKDCVFVGADTTCTSPTCATGTAVAAATCNGIGACSTPTTKECAPYICGVDACRTDCTIDDQCVKGFTCVGGACKSGAQCLPDGSSKGKDGTVTPCAPYACGGDGLCVKNCSASADCVGGATCDVAAKVCVPPGGGDTEDSGGCTTSSGRGHDATWAMLAVLGVFVTARTSARRARRAARRNSDTA